MDFMCSYNYFLDPVIKTVGSIDYFSEKFSEFFSEKITKNLIIVWKLRSSAVHYFLIVENEDGSAICIWLIFSYLEVDIEM